MCNRYRSSRDQHYLAERFQAFDEIEFRPRFNVAPTQPIPAIRRESNKRKITMMRWGLIPSWASVVSAGNFNARSETITTTPSFRDAIFDRRCLIPADGFYEWQQMGTIKQPFCFEVGTGELFAFAGLWDEWKNPAGEMIKSCTILTTTANALVAHIHDRMPVILPPEKYDLWLDTEAHNLEPVLAALQPYDAGAMHRYAVSTRLNDSRNDDSECTKPIEFESAEQAWLF